MASLHGKMSIGILLIEDLLAILAMMLLSVMSLSVASSNLGLELTLVVLKGTLLLLCAVFAGRYLLPRLFSEAARNQELVFLMAISWCLAYVSLATLLGYSLAIGAFLAGLSLAQSTYRVSISGRVKPLRDFFMILFFIGVGGGQVS